MRSGLILITLLSVVFGASAAFAETHTADVIPWSGYWWPYHEGGLGTGNGYNGSPAPIEKYEFYAEGFAPGKATAWYKDTYFDPYAPGWYGLCYAWAAAACYETGDILPSSVDNIRFRVGDKKGLLTLAHTYDIVESGNGNDPSVFHYWLLHYIKDLKKPFVADLSAGEEIWSYPIYKFDMSTTQSADALSVSVTIYYADDFVEPDYMGTKTKQQKLTYKLNLAGDGSITNGEWTGSSLQDHPEELTYPLVPRSHCPYLEYDTVAGIVSDVDDFLEGSTDPLPTGHYRLTLFDTDAYTLHAQNGDFVDLLVEVEDPDDVSVVITNTSGETVMEKQLSGLDTTFAFTQSVTAAPYTLTLSHASDKPVVYTVTSDIKKSFTRQVLYLPRGSSWSGFAATNPEAEPIPNLAVSAYNTDGTPIQTIFGPQSLQPGKKSLFVFSDLSAWSIDAQNIGYVEMHADAEFSFVNLFAGASGMLSSFVQANEPQSRIIIPQTRPQAFWGEIMSGGIVNRESVSASVDVAVYKQDGSLSTFNTYELKPKEMLAIEPGTSPFYNLPADGWVEASEQSGLNLSGYQYTRKRTYYKSDTLFALSANTQTKYLPHIPAPGTWSTLLTLINTSELAGTLTLHPAASGADTSGDVVLSLGPKEKTVVAVDEIFAAGAYGSPYRSVLEISGDVEFTGYYRYSTENDEAALPLADADDIKQTLVLPHFPGYDPWWTGVAVGNTLSTGQTVRMQPYDADGNELSALAQSFDINPGEYWIQELYSRFGPVSAPDVSFIRFTAVDGAGGLCGFYLYGNNDNTLLSGGILQ